MATILSHGLVGWTVAKVFHPRKDSKFLWLSFLIPMIPDLDFIGFVTGVPYDSPWGHRGLTHSLVFALVAGFVVAFVFHGRERKNEVLKLSLFYGFLISTHGILDALTNGGLGVAFFAPYNDMRYFFSWRPVEVSPMGARIFSQRGLVVLTSELVWFFAPCGLLLLLKMLYQRTLAKKAARKPSA